jgi:hypothetical protein
MIGAVVLAAGALLVPDTAFAQLSRSTCADCHFSHPEAPAQDHLSNWGRSPHGRHDVGCEQCHGGDAATFEALAAHRGILSPQHVKSPVNRRNLPATCGGCHVGPFVAFQDSRHYELLNTGQEGGPTCSTCHETVGGRLLPPKALESRCAGCHGPDEIAPRAGRARSARQTYERLAQVRADLKLAQDRIKQITSPARRTELSDAYARAEVPIIRAVNAGHKFVYGELVEYTAIARERIDALLALIETQQADR